MAHSCVGVIYIFERRRGPQTSRALGKTITSFFLTTGINEEIGECDHSFTNIVASLPLYSACDASFPRPEQILVHRVPAAEQTRSASERDILYKRFLKIAII